MDVDRARRVAAGGRARRARSRRAPSVDLQPTVYVAARRRARRWLRALRDRPELRFALLAELTAVDFWPREPRFEVVYLLVSLEHRLRAAR